MEFAYRWRPVKPLPERLDHLANTELQTLRSVWLEQKATLEGDGLVDDFTRRLIREYAIEGGIIERAYTLDRGVTQLLIDRGIDASLIPHGATNKDPLHVAQMIEAHAFVLDSVFEMIQGIRPLTTAGIKQMHAALLRHETHVSAMDSLGRIVDVPLLKGTWKTSPNNPRRLDDTIHEYCPPEHVSSEMDRLLAYHQDHENRRVPTEVAAAWLHHAFTQIHPFQDGNGRIARLIASYVFIKDHYFPLTLVDQHDRDAYLNALESADDGNLKPLINLFSRVQRRSIVKVLGIAGTVTRLAGIDQVIAAARNAYVARQGGPSASMEQAKATARVLHGIATGLLEEVAQKLQRELGALSPDFHFRVDAETNEGQRRYYFRAQVVQVARMLDYYANTSLYHDWVRLIINTDDQSEILVSLHGIGHEYRGLLAASVGFYRRVATEEGERETTPAVSPAQSLLQINYLEPAADAEARFKQWLQEELTGALEMWRMNL
jgi:hypothetical protein